MPIATPNKTWAVTLWTTCDLMKTKIVTNCVDWNEALKSAFPGYHENLVDSDGTEITDEDHAHDIANAQDWDFNCHIIDETKL